MLLYIHVPFCRSKCRYCSFFSHSLPQNQLKDELISAYVKNILAELKFWSAHLGNLPVETIFFGGGTPSLLPVKDVAKILNSIRKFFAVAHDAEISFEANPDSILEFGYSFELFASGVNRISLGVQSFNDDFLKVLGRRHSSKEAFAAYEVCRSSGFSNISLDLMWALPEQRLRLWLDDLKQAVKLKPEHLSCYNLSIDEGTPIFAAFNEGLIKLPDDDVQGQMYRHGLEYLNTEGYLHYEISNFARMGFQCRHNLGYWQGENYLGLGPAATSTLNKRRWTNPADLKLWIEKVQAQSIGSGGEKLSKEEQVLELIMLSLRMSKGLFLADYKALMATNFIDDNRTLIEALYAKGLIRIKNGYFSLTSAGMLVSNSILEYLFDETKKRLRA